MKREQKKKIYAGIATAWITIIVVMICVSIYQSNYRKGIREWILDYNEQAKEYNDSVVEKNNSIDWIRNHNLNKLELITIIPEDIADDKEIKKISEKLKKYEDENDMIMKNNETIVNKVRR